ncbi:MAG: hypothetical protein RIS47_2220 [Bacteroidota bacterium]|jgi:glycosyltransferase involved in cell wall biosynthesis
MVDLSVIIPVFNESENIATLHREVADMCLKEGLSFEIIVVDDGSTDGTWGVLQKLVPVTLIRFRKNFGQTAAFDAGIKAAKGRLIATMDGDGQNDPADIPAMIRFLEMNEFDMVSGWRKFRKDPFLKRFVSRGANFLRSVIVHDHINDSGCSLKVFRAECFENISLYGEMHRFIPALLSIRGFSVGEVVVNHRPRLAGKTKYSWQRTFKGLIDMVSVWFWTKYAVRPLHLLGGLGLILISFGFCSGFYTLYDYFYLKQSLSDSASPLLTAFLLLSGLQLFISGLLADAILKNYFESTPNKPYYISKIISTTSYEKTI